MVTGDNMQTADQRASKIKGVLEKKSEMDKKSNAKTGQVGVRPASHRCCWR